MPLRELPKFFLKLGNTREYGQAIDSFIEANIKFTGAAAGKRSKSARDALARLVDRMMTHSLSRHAGGMAGSYMLENTFATGFGKFRRGFWRVQRRVESGENAERADVWGANIRRYAMVPAPDVAKAPKFMPAMARRLTGELVQEG